MSASCLYSGQENTMSLELCFMSDIACHCECSCQSQQQLKAPPSFSHAFTPHTQSAVQISKGILIPVSPLSQGHSMPSQ